ncbi:hypothetical protein [Chlamydia crocodili]|uniref:hypothetical protein n=1 Tax=Chlamydia crocodili TaxID=2766982 RepID=UPI003D4FD41B
MSVDIKDLNQKNEDLNTQYFDTKSEIRGELDECKNLLKKANNGVDELQTMLKDNQYYFAFITKQKNIPISKNPSQKI